MSAPNPFVDGLSPNLIPNPPPEMPGAPGPGDAMSALTPFTEAQDVDSIIKQLVLDRPLKLFIPNREKYAGWEFRIINSIPQEIAAANNKGFRQVTDPELSKLFDDLVAGTDKSGKAFRPLLFARSSEVGKHIRKQNRRQLQSLYAGMDPTNKDMTGRYTKNVGSRDGTEATFNGAGWQIKV
jgi:hypothetical protein